jgi:hypothetical protein
MSAVLIANSHFLAQEPSVAVSSKAVRRTVLTGIAVSHNFTLA